MLTRHLSTNLHRAVAYRLASGKRNKKRENQKTVACQQAPGVRFFRLLAGNGSHGRPGWDGQAALKYATRL